MLTIAHKRRQCMRNNAEVDMIRVHYPLLVAQFDITQSVLII